MIKTWKHKGLKRFFEQGLASGILPAHRKRLKMLLERLNAAVNADDLNLPGMRFHQLSGDLKGFYSVGVSGNWRLIFKFEGSDAILVDYLDYH